MAGVWRCESARPQGEDQEGLWPAHRGGGESGWLLKAECPVLPPGQQGLSALRFGKIIGPIAHSAEGSGSGSGMASWPVWSHLGSRHAPLVGTQLAESVGMLGGASALSAWVVGLLLSY